MNPILLGSFTTRRSLVGASVATLLLQATRGGAQPVASSYPTHALRLVVPTGPGGPTDLLARVLAERLAAVWGQAVLVDNKGGAAQMLGADAVAKSPPDGHVLLLASDSAITINPSLYPRMPYDPQKDLRPVAQVASLPLVLVLHPSVAANSVQELVRLAKARPVALAFGSGGATSRMGAELFRVMTGVDMLHVPYKGSGPMVIALVGNEIQLAFDGISSSLAQIRAGRLKALAVSGRSRVAALPDVPTVAEAGVAGYEAGAWLGLFAPAGTPQYIVARLHADTARVLDDAAVRDRLAQLGMTPVMTPGDVFAVQIGEETVKWNRVIRQAGITADN